MAGKKLRLVHNWKDAHTWASMWWSAAGFIFSVVELLDDIWDGLDHTLQNKIPYAGLTGMLLFLGSMIGRVVTWAHDHMDHAEGDDAGN